MKQQNLIQSFALLALVGIQLSACTQMKRTPHHGKLSYATIKGGSCDGELALAGPDSYTGYLSTAIIDTGEEPVGIGKGFFSSKPTTINPHKVAGNVMRNPEEEKAISELSFEDVGQSIRYLLEESPAPPDAKVAFQKVAAGAILAKYGYRKMGEAVAREEGEEDSIVLSKQAHNFYQSNFKNPRRMRTVRPYIASTPTAAAPSASTNAALSAAGDPPPPATVPPTEPTGPVTPGADSTPVAPAEAPPAQQEESVAPVEGSENEQQGPPEQQYISPRLGFRSAIVDAGKKQGTVVSIPDWEGIEIPGSGKIKEPIVLHIPRDREERGSGVTSQIVVQFKQSEGKKGGILRHCVIKSDNPNGYEAKIPTVWPGENQGEEVTLPKGPVIMTVVRMYREVRDGVILETSNGTRGIINLEEKK